MKGRLRASVCALGMLAAAPACAVGTGMTGRSGSNNSANAMGRTATSGGGLRNGMQR